MVNLSWLTFCLKHYSVEVYEWSGSSWEPYMADDLQVQFYMMSPYVLKTMSTDKKVPFFVDVSDTFCVLLCQRVCLCFYFSQYHIIVYRASIIHLSRFLMFMVFSNSRLSIRDWDIQAWAYQSRYLSSRVSWCFMQWMFSITINYHGDSISSCLFI